jgi:hypothetical protein
MSALFFNYQQKYVMKPCGQLSSTFISGLGKTAWRKNPQFTTSETCQQTTPQKGSFGGPIHGAIPH